MVQYIITPWRNRQELFDVREAFYPPSDTNEATHEEEQRNAVALVSMWVQRGNCPHSVESTALLVAAILNEETGNTAYAMRAAYSAAFCRFVTGLLDGYQDRRHKMSMYSIAKNIGLPATFVELRHQCTHEELPSLARLRNAAQRSLTWIWDHYWKALGIPSTSGDIEECRTILYEYLTRWATMQPEEMNQYIELGSWLEKWHAARVQEVLMEIMESSKSEPRILLQAIRLSKEVMFRNEKDSSIESSIGKPPREIKRRTLEEIQAEVGEVKRALQKEEDNVIAPAERTENYQNADMMDDNEDSDDDDDGWQMWKGPWIPKPIGVV